MCLRETITALSMSFLVVGRAAGNVVCASGSHEWFSVYEYQDAACVYSVGSVKYGDGR